MKKILLFFVALVATLSMNAQTTEIYKGNTLQKAYYGADVTVSFGENSITVTQGKVKDSYEGSEYKVVSKELPPPPTGSIGKAKRTGNIDVNWVQLWEGGPKFATYNVGAKDSTEYGGYYAWGGSNDKVDDHNTTNTGSGNLSNNNNTATNLWGSNWRMPTREELAGLLNNCDVQWTANYNGTGKAGRIFTGKGDYASNSIFLPATGYNEGNVIGQGSLGYYWSSTPNGSDNAYFLSFGSGSNNVGYNSRSYGYSVRAVLKELPPSPAGSTGNAKRAGNVYVNWVQLWKNGPKFAVYNVGATSAIDYGGYYNWGMSEVQTPSNYSNYKSGTDPLTGDDDTATKLWGENWRMPTEKELEALLSSCDVEWMDGVTTKYNNTTAIGLLCTGKGAYASNSIFLPAAGYCLNGGVIYQGGRGEYWSSTTKGTMGINACYMYFTPNMQSVDDDSLRDYGYSVRAVLAK